MSGGRSNLHRIIPWNFEGLLNPNLFVIYIYIIHIHDVYIYTYVYESLFPLKRIQLQHPFIHSKAHAFNSKCSWMSKQGSLQSRGSISYMGARQNWYRFVLENPEILQPEWNSWVHIQILILVENFVSPFPKLWTSFRHALNISSGRKIASHEVRLWWLRVLNLLHAWVRQQVGIGSHL